MNIERIVHRPVTVLVFFVLLILISLYTIGQIPVELRPNSMFAPGFTIETAFPGGSSEEVEIHVTAPLEESFSRINGLKSIESLSERGKSRIFIEINYGASLSSAIDEARDKIEEIRLFGFPRGVKTPRIFKTNVERGSLMDLSLTGNRSLTDLRELATKEIEPLLERLEGIASVRTIGGAKKLLQVAVPSSTLEAIGISMEQIAAVLSSDSWKVAGGSVKEGLRRYEVLFQAQGDPSNLEEIRRRVIREASTTEEGSPVSPLILEDIATVSFVSDDTGERSFLDNEPAVTISLRKNSEANALQVAKQVKKQIATLNRTFPQGVHLQVTHDSTHLISIALTQLTSAGIQGAIFAILVLLIFLRNLRATLIVALSIPVSFLITLFCMFLRGITLNVMTLAGLILGMGMVVDSSIVIIENIFRYLEKGTRPTSAAILGSTEVLRAIRASILTTVSVFLPIIVFRGRLDLVGPPLQDIAFTVIVSLLVSLGVAMSLVPVLSSLYLSTNVTSAGEVKPQKKRRLSRLLNSAFERFYQIIHNGYKWALIRAFAHKGPVLGGAFVLLFLSFFVARVLGFTLVPPLEETGVQVQIQMEPGTTLAYGNQVLSRLYQLINETDLEYENAQAKLSEHEISLVLTVPEGPGHKEKILAIKEALRPHLQRIPGGRFSFPVAALFETTSPISLLFHSSNTEEAVATANKLLALIKTSLPELENPSINISEGAPRIEIQIDATRAQSLGLSLPMVHSLLEDRLSGVKASDLRLGGERFETRVVLQEGSEGKLLSLSQLRDMGIPNKEGTLIPLSAFSSIERGFEPLSIRRVDQKRTVTLSADLAPGHSASKATQRVKTLIAEKLNVPDTLQIDYGGSSSKFLAVAKELVILLVIAIALIFGIMASQFESLRDPFLIFLTLPFMFVGVVLLHLITGIDVTAMTVVGLIILAGIVVNNGIVLVDYTNLLRARGYPLEKACLEAGLNRLRPVLITSLTTILAVVPMSFFSQGEVALIQPLGQAIVGGMLFSSASTLLLLPLLYYLFNRKTQRDSV